MAYVIGSQKGKDIAKNMKTGETYKCSDGSVWTKEKDGSVTVKTSGNTYKNAYTPTSTGGSSGGGSSNKSGGNSQYSSPYGNVDLGTLGQTKMNEGASWEVIQDIYNERYKKATSTPGLNQYANDDIQQQMWQYIQKNMQQTNQPDEWVDYELDNPRPTTPERDPRIDALLNEILNRDDFSYDAMNDPLYQQYAQMYRREGDRAMRNTLAEAAAGAGGMNTYAITAAQQANNYYNSQLNDKIPELYQLAYDMYLNDKESKVQDLGILQDMDATQFARYQDTMQNWKDDRNFAYGVYQDAVQQGNWQTNFDYNAMLADRDFMNSEYWKNKEFNANQEQIAYNRNQAEKDEAKEKVMLYIENGITTISPELIAKAGLTQEEVNLLITAAQAQMGTSGTYSSRRNSNVPNDEPEEEEEGDDVKINAINLGIGPISDETVLQLANSGKVIIDSKGNTKWANGYGPDNYKKVTLPGLLF